MRLAPPPKVGSPAGRAPAIEAAESGRERRRATVHWLTALVFVVLIAVAVTVFVFLPGWVAERATAGDAEASPSSSPSPRTTLAAETPPAAETAAAAEADPAADTIGDTDTQDARASTTEGLEKTPPAAAPTNAPAPTDRDRMAFGRAMTEGLGALDRGELGAARAAFEQALALSPGAAEATDGLARVEAAEQLAAIAAHRERAAALETEEDWEGALAEYDAVLELDPSLRFAGLGQARARERLELVRGLDRHLEHPDRLRSDQVLEEARDLLERARETDPAGSKLVDRIERLERQVAIASTPVRVVLISDGLTDVLVYRVGRLGTFQRRELELRPGRYTVVGAREGFRDVRLELDVSPNGTSGPLTVRCEEKV